MIDLARQGRYLANQFFLQSISELLFQHIIIRSAATPAAFLPSFEPLIGYECNNFRCGPTWMPSFEIRIFRAWKGDVDRRKGCLWVRSESRQVAVMIWGRMHPNISAGNPKVGSCLFGSDVQAKMRL